MSRTYSIWLASAAITGTLLFTAGCQTTVCDLEDVSSPTPMTYRDDTPAYLIDSYLLAWNAYDDDDVYYLRTPLSEQNEADRQAFIDNGANKCRWNADWWGMAGGTPSEDRNQTVVDVQVVSSAEGYTTLQLLRFNLQKEGDRWLVTNHEWVGEYLELRNYISWTE